MFNFNATNKTPGVYVQEIDRPGPIAGVATSVAAIIGPAAQGPIGVPTRLTNFTQFSDRFGGYISSPPVYATHAVKAFFANGGSNLYYVRVGTAQRSSLTLDDRSAGPAATIGVEALSEGVAGDAITVEVQDASLASTTIAVGSANLAGAGASGADAEVDDATVFRPGDRVSVTVGANPPETKTVSSIAGNTLHLDSNLANAGAAGSVRIADVAVDQRKLRVADSTGLEAGSAIVLTQGGTTAELVVSGVESTNHVLTVGSDPGSVFGLDAGGGDLPVQVDSQEFTLIVTHPDDGPESFDDLAMDPRHSRYYRSVLSAATHVAVTPAEPPNSTAPPDNRPAVLAATNLAGGADDDKLALMGPSGVPEYQAALDELKKVDEVTLVLAPDRTDLTVQQAIIDHCETLHDRFAILDAQRGADPALVTGQRNALSSNRGFGALYYPWLVISDPDSGDPLLVPPSGHLAGLYSRVDDQRGVHKAPANETLRGVIGLERILADDEQGPLNEIGVNVVRSFVGRGIRVWGARTIAPAAQTQWRYINVRRLLLFIEESIQEGTENAVFEPNNQALWESVKRRVNGFLNRVWQSGALVGTTPEQAYRVRIDEELNPPETRALGQLRIEVRVAPTTPAEFIVFFVTQQPGEPIIDE